MRESTGDYASDGPDARGSDGRPAPPDRAPRPSLEGRASVLDRLEVRCREANAWDHFLDRCLERYHASTSDGERAGVLVRAARILRTELDDPEQAFDAAMEAIRLDPSNQEAVVEVTEVASVREVWPQAIDLIRAFLEAEPEPWRRLALCEQAVRWCREHLRALPDAADPFLVEIHRIDPSHWAVRRRLASYYREQGIWDLRREELERALLRARSDDEMRDTHCALGELYELRLGDLTRALEHYEAAHACAPQSIEPLHGLDRIAERRESFDKLREVIEKQLALVSEPEERRDLLLRLADLWERRFLKPANAAPLLEEALRLDPKNRDALDALERCYRAARAWPEYVRTMERRQELSPLREARVQSLMRIGQAYESALGDPARALDAYRRACALDATHVEALTELARLCERFDDWRGAADCRERLAELAQTDDVRLHLHLAIGAALEPANRDPDRARRHYERALSVDRGCAAAWEALQRLAVQQGDWKRAADCAAARVPRTEGRRAKARLLAEVGVLWERAGHRDRAIGAYEEAQRIAPDDAAAQGDLFRLYAEEGRWANAAAFCGALLRRAVDDRDPARALELLRASRSIVAATGDAASAVSMAQRAFTAFPEQRAITFAVIELLHELREHDAALRPAREALESVVDHPSGLDAIALVRVGETLWAIGATDRGVDAFVAALDLDDACLPALAHLVEHFTAQRDHERAVAYRLWMARATPDQNVRFALLLEAGESLAEEARDPAQAAWVYEEARALRPRDRRLLDRLVSLYTATGAWDRVLDVQRSIVDFEELPALKASRLRSMALVARSKVGDPARAAQLFEEAMAQDPTRLEALDELTAIHIEHKDWRALPRVHGRVLLRAERGAAAATQSVVTYLPLAGSSLAGARATRERTEISTVTPAAAILGADSGFAGDPQIRALREKVAGTPLSAPAYRALYAVFRKRGANDAAWVIANVLEHLGVVDAEQRRFLSSLRAPELHEASGVLTEGDWYTSLLDPKLDRPLLAALNVAAAASVRARGQAERMGRALGDPLGSRGSAARIGRLVREAALVLRIPAPTVLERARMASPFAVTPSPAPTLVVSQPSLEAIPAGALRFVLGRHLAELHPLLWLRSAYPTPSELRRLFDAATRAVDGDDPSSSAAGLRGALDDAERADLADAIAMTRHRARLPDFDDLLRRLEISAIRAGLLLQGNVDRAWAALRREARRNGEAPDNDLHAELLTWAISAEHLQLRETTGLAMR